MLTCMMLTVTACASSKRESVWRGRAPVRLRGGGAVLSQLGNAPALEAELGAARAALDASQKAARKARREARRREASLQLELDALEAVSHADALREPVPLALGDGPLTPLALGDAATEVSAAVGVLAHDQATSLAAPEASSPPAQSGVTRAFRLLNSAVLLSCAFGLAAAPSRSIGLLLQVRAPTCFGSTYHGCRYGFVPEERTREVHTCLPWLHLLWLYCSRLTSRAMGPRRASPSSPRYWRARWPGCSPW